MSKSYLRKNRIAGQFSARTIAMIESPAFQVLSLAGHRVLARIEIEHAHHGGNDNGRLSITFDDFAGYGMDRHAIAPALREVCALGFVEITEQGRAGNAEWRRPNKFRLTYRHAGRANPTDEWNRIKTVEEAAMIAQRARVSHHRKKNKTPVGVFANFQCGNPHRKPAFHSVETPTTGHSGKTHTTSRLSGKPRSGRARSSLATQQSAEQGPKLPWSTPVVIEVTDPAEMRAQDQIKIAKYELERLRRRHSQEDRARRLLNLRPKPRRVHS
jgi:hypothetical protein